MADLQAPRTMCSGASHLPLSLTFTAARSGGRSYFFHFTGEDTEPQREEAFYPRSHSQYVVKLRCDPQDFGGVQSPSPTSLPICPPS